VVTFLDECEPALDRASTSFLDLGCGNGSLLLALRAAGWGGPCLGVDYSAQSIELARSVADCRVVGNDGDGALNAVNFVVWDVLRGDVAEVLAPVAGAWDVVLDKGTFDAVSLSSETDDSGRRLNEQYRTRVLQLLRPGGRFVVTSCNWTEDELREWFAQRSANGDELRLEEAGRVKYRSFSFGGIKGQTISTMCFMKTA
jgi:EEF1A lysine methyltransferase 2